ncbi:MAG TPA: sigma factor, partial [Jatrophihabitans sp.]|nr:sigma factor [Jatrophihabitans sp.]
MTARATDATNVALTEHQPNRDELVTEHLPLVGHLVRELMHRLPAHVNRDDLVSAGSVALVLSARSFDPARGVPFARFAAIRIRGALTDELRTMDWASRAVRSRAREVET